MFRSLATPQSTCSKPWGRIRIQQYSEDFPGTLQMGGEESGEALLFTSHGDDGGLFGCRTVQGGCLSEPHGASWSPYGAHVMAQQQQCSMLVRPPFLAPGLLPGILLDFGQY